MKTPLEMLRHHVTGAIERGEKQAILEIRNPLSVDQAEIARRKAAAPLRPTKPQAAPDCGLFSDDAAQVDLCDLINGSRK